VQRPVERLRADADKCRDLARTSLTPDARDILAELADEYDRQVVDCEKHPRARARPVFVWALG
jgi:hypothetical protein